MSETRESERRGGHYELLWMEQSHDSERMAIQFIDNVQEQNWILFLCTSNMTLE